MALGAGSLDVMNVEKLGIWQGIVALRQGGAAGVATGLVVAATAEAAAHAAAHHTNVAVLAVLAGAAALIAGVAAEARAGAVALLQGRALFLLGGVQAGAPEYGWKRYVYAFRHRQGDLEHYKPHLRILLFLLGTVLC